MRHKRRLLQPRAKWRTVGGRDVRDVLVDADRSPAASPSRVRTGGRNIRAKAHRTTSVSLSSGPNETLRGIAATTAAGGVLVTAGGPNERARGAAVQSTTAPSVIPSGGPARPRAEPRCGPPSTALRSRGARSATAAEPAAARGPPF